MINKIVVPRGHTTRQILIADDDDDMVTLLTQRCSSLGCSVIGANNALDALNVIHRLTPDLVCLDVNMPSGNGLSVCEMMASDERLRKIPIIIMTGQDDPSTIRRCHDLLAYYVQKSGDTWQRIEPLLRELLQLDGPENISHPTPNEDLPVPILTNAPAAASVQHNLVDAVFEVLGAAPAANREVAESRQDLEATPTAAPGTEPLDVPWVLCIDDDADFTDALRIRLEQHGVAVARAFNGMAGYRLAFTSPASAILLDYNMPNGQGDYVLSRLKDNPVTRPIPVVVISGARDKTLQRRMLSMGATAFFEKPVVFEQLRDHLSNFIDILDVGARHTPKSGRLTSTV